MKKTVLEFYNDNRKADPRIFIEIPEGSKHDIFSSDGKYLCSANSDLKKIMSFFTKNDLPLNKQIKKAKPADIDKTKCLTTRPVQILDIDYVLEILRKNT